MAMTERPSKRAKLLDAFDSDSDGNSSDEAVPANGFKINEEFAKRFEHNKKREEQHRLEEKHGSSLPKAGLKRSRSNTGSEEDDGEDSSSDESEDDDAELATKDLDDEIFAALQAIKTKDPRVYDKTAKFYKEYDAETNNGGSAKSKDKPMYLRDYHRNTLLAGNTGDDEDVEMVQPMRTYQDEQDQLRRDLVGSMHATAANGHGGDSGSEEDDLLVAKSSTHRSGPPRVLRTQITEQDVADADKDPETYLSNFMAARAWLPSEGSKWQAFESDNSEDEDRADEFEAAYNMRFEDPATANEKLQSFARDVAKYSARRDEKSGRARARDREREKKDAAKQEREEERARLRKLRIDEAEEKVKKIKHAAGLRGQDVDLEQWRGVIEGDFDDDTWEKEMKAQFGDAYYAEIEDDDASGDEDDAGSRRSKTKKPEWDDDIDINDIVPDFDDGSGKPDFTISSDDDAEGGIPVAQELNSKDTNKAKTKKDRAKEKANAKRTARLERRQIEEMVDSSLPLAHPSLAQSSTSSKAPVTGFRYRQTSPTNFGLSARDILFADDSQLNQYAGLKKLAMFRDEEKKRRDKKRFSKKARLREWRKETFGDQNAPEGGFERILGGKLQDGKPPNKPKNSEDGEKQDQTKKKKKRSRKSKKLALRQKIDTTLSKD